ncbi:MAG: class I SAM-dependent methyltransferase [Alphaproteobacteria bacterium]|nr:class I SAM-dependent methyltransferase [Alphaproteobacteria bacterium]
MPNPQTWAATKAELHNGRWRASRDPAEVTVGSRIIGDILTDTYERLLRTHARGVLVDVGCGKAPYFGIYRGIVTKSVGVDWESSIHASDQVDIKCDLNEKIALPDAFADTILCTDVLEHLFEPQRAWNEIARILKPGGKAIIGVPFLYWIHEAPHDYHRYTSFALRKYATVAGLCVESLEAAGGLSQVLADLLCKSVRPGLLQSLVDRACRLALRVSMRRNTRSDTPFPLCYVLVASKPRVSAPAPASRGNATATL